MDIIERLFGVSPDGGDGSTELMYVAALCVAVAMTIGVVLKKKLLNLSR